MRIPVSRGIMAVFRRVFFVRISLRDRFAGHNRVGRSGINCVPLCVQSSAHDKQPGDNCGENFQ